MSYWQALRSRYAITADPLRTQRRIELAVLLLGAVILLQLIVGFTRLALMMGPAALEPAADSMRVPEVVGTPLVPAADRNEIITRPLFWVGRRPLEAVAVVEQSDAGAKGAAELDKVRLVGVFGGGDTGGVIVLVEGKKRRILLGEELDGWTLKAIGPGEGVFVRGARRETLELDRVDLALVATEASAVGAGGEQEAGTEGGGQSGRWAEQEAVTAGDSGGDRPARSDAGKDKIAGKKAERGLSLGPGAR